MEYNPYELLYMSHFDEYAQVALFRQYKPLINAIAHSCIMKYLPLQDYRDDLIQEGRIAVYYAAETYRNDQNASFLTYVTIVVKRRLWAECRKIYNHITVNGSQLVRLDNMVNEEEALYGSVPQRDPFCDPEYYTHFVSAAERLRETFRKLNREEVQLVECWLSKSTYKEGAAKMDMTVKTYESRLQKGRRKVKNAVYG